MGGVSEDYISLTEIKAYFWIAKITDLEERFDYLKFLSILDNAYLKYKQEHRPDPDPDKDNPQGNSKKGKR